MGKIAEMTPDLQIKYAAFAARMAEAHVPFGLNEVLRTKRRQLAYACQGRTYDELLDLLQDYGWAKAMGRINLLRASGKTIQETCDIIRAEEGMYLLKGKEWDKITWTMNSRHFAGPDGLSRAFDIKIFKPGQVPTWDTKYDADMDGTPEYKEAAEIGRGVGLIAGADFKDKKGRPNPDWPHFQL